MLRLSESLLRLVKAGCENWKIGLARMPKNSSTSSGRHRFHSAGEDLATRRIAAAQGTESWLGVSPLPTGLSLAWVLAYVVSVAKGLFSDFGRSGWGIFIGGRELYLVNLAIRAA